MIFLTVDNCQTVFSKSGLQKMNIYLTMEVIVYPISGAVEPISSTDKNVYLGLKLGPRLMNVYQNFTQDGVKRTANINYRFGLGDGPFGSLSRWDKFILSLERHNGTSLQYVQPISWSACISQCTVFILSDKIQKKKDSRKCFEINDLFIGVPQ